MEIPEASPRPDMFKILALKMCQEEQIEVLLHLQACDTVVENHRLEAVEFYGKGNRVQASKVYQIDQSTMKG